MCDRAAESCLLALKFTHDWFVTKNIIEEVDSAVFYED